MDGITITGDTPTLTHEEAAAQMYSILSSVDRSEAAELAERVLWFVLHTGVKPQYQATCATEVLLNVLKRFSGERDDLSAAAEADGNFKNIKGNA